MLRDFEIKKQQDAIAIEEHKVKAIEDFTCYMDCFDVIANSLQQGEKITVFSSAYVLKTADGEYCGREIAQVKPELWDALTMLSKEDILLKGVYAYETQITIAHSTFDGYYTKEYASYYSANSFKLVKTNLTFEEIEQDVDYVDEVERLDENWFFILESHPYGC